MTVDALVYAFSAAVALYVVAVLIALFKDR
jgi:hypothetical protein